jgi:hypothetical protein
MDIVAGTGKWSLMADPYGQPPPIVVPELDAPPTQLPSRDT